MCWSEGPWNEENAWTANDFQPTGVVAVVDYEPPSPPSPPNPPPPPSPSSPPPLPPSPPSPPVPPMPPPSPPDAPSPAIAFGVTTVPVAVSITFPVVITIIIIGIVAFCVYKRRQRKRSRKVAHGRGLPEALSNALAREFYKRHGRDPTETEKLGLLSNLMQKGKMELAVANCPPAVLAAARADYEAHTGEFADDKSGVAYMRSILGDRIAMPEGEPLKAEELMKALRAEFKKKTGREPTKDELFKMLSSVVKAEYEGEAGSSSNAPKLPSMPSDVMTALKQFAHNNHAPETARELLKLGGKLVVDGATTAGVQLSEVEKEAEKQSENLELLASTRVPEVQPVFEAQHEFSSGVRVSEELKAAKDVAPTGRTRSSLQLTEVLTRKHSAATLIAAVWKGRIARRAFRAQLMLVRASPTKVQSTLARAPADPNVADGQAAASIAKEVPPKVVPLKSATRLAVAQEHRAPPPPPPAKKVRAAPQLVPVMDVTDMETAVERRSSFLEKPPDHRPPPRLALPAATDERLARAIAARSAFRSGSQDEPSESTPSKVQQAIGGRMGPNPLERMAALRSKDKGETHQEAPATSPIVAPPIEEGVVHRKMPVPPSNARRGGGGTFSRAKVSDVPPVAEESTLAPAAQDL